MAAAGTEEGEGKGGGYREQPACLAGWHVGATATATGNLMNYANTGETRKVFPSQIQFFQAASTNKQIVCYYRWVALPDRVIAQD